MKLVVDNTKNGGPPRRRHMNNPRTRALQEVEYFDVWDAGEDPLTGNRFLEDHRIASGVGTTEEGHGDGIRVLVNRELETGLIVKYLRALALNLEEESARFGGGDS